jgi:hypothetical protein
VGQPYLCTIHCHFGLGLGLGFSPGKPVKKRETIKHGLILLDRRRRGNSLFIEGCIESKFGEYQVYVRSVFPRLLYSRFYFHIGHPFRHYFPSGFLFLL